MEYFRIKDIDFKSNIDGRVYGIFMASDVEVRTQKDGVTRYLSLNMCDRDIKIDVKRFGTDDTEIEMLKNGGIYRGAIDIKRYDKAPLGFSCTLYNFEPHNDNPASFVCWADGMEEAQQIIQNTLNKLTGTIYQNIAANLIRDNWTSFCCWTAANSFHHDIMGGLLVHTAEVIEGSENIATMWERKYGPNFINKPLLLSAALLHDIAKVKELELDKVSGVSKYSNQASLETHITMGVSMIELEAYKLQLGYKTETKTDEQVKIEQEAMSLLKHCILAHHGKREYGSPIDMNCPEAYIINTADLLSSEMYRYNKNFKTLESGSSNCVWLGGNMVVTYKDSTK